MKFVRVVPVFNKFKQVEVFIPQFSGFTEEEEIAVLEKLAPLIKVKRWAFCEYAIPAGFTAAMVTQNSGEERFAKIRKSGFDVIGYDFEIKVGVQALLEWCYAIAIDINYPEAEKLLRLAELYSGRHIRKIALCVCSNDEFDLCLRQGYEYMIGDFYTKTIISDIGDDKLHPVKANKLAILSEVRSWDDDFARQNTDKVLEIIQRDMFMTLALIKLSNSTMFGGRTEVTNLKDAIVRIGYKNLKNWVLSLLPGAIADEKTPEITKVALLRAKFMENLAIKFNLDSSMAFYTGLLSVSGVMLGISFEAAILEIGAPEAVISYLNYRDRLGQLFGLVETYISGEKDRFTLYSHIFKLDTDIYEEYIEAELWVNEIVKATEDATEGLKQKEREKEELAN